MQQRTFRKWGESLRVAIHDIQILRLFGPSEGVEECQDILVCEGIFHVVSEKLLGGRGVKHFPELSRLARLTSEYGHQSLKSLGQHSTQKRSVDGHERADAMSLTGF